MPPLIAHRRSRRRTRARRIAFLLVALLVTAALIGGITRIGARSGPYDASVNRSFAAQGAVVVKESNVTASSLRSLMRTMQRLDRPTLESDLDSLVAQSTAQSAAVAALASPGSPGDVQEQFATVFSDRARAVDEFRAAIDGLLGLHPLPVAGAPVASDTDAATPTLLSSTEATDRIAAAGALLALADRNYRTVRHSLARIAGRAALPASTWVTAAGTWQPTAVAGQVGLIASSTSLAATQRLVLSAVQIVPPGLPNPSGSTSGVSVLSPTTRVVLNVVLSNLGSTDEPHAAVQYTLAPQPSGRAATLTRRAAVASGNSVTLSAASFPVKPGLEYQLTVAVVGPAGLVGAAGTTLTQMLQIAPRS
jgi:hypothetical protein